MQCPELEPGHLTDPIRLEMPGAGFDIALAAAKNEARRIAPEPMLIAWYDAKAGRFSPNVTCCDEERPAWLVYATSRGADITVAINGLDYVFLFKRG